MVGDSLISPPAKGLNVSDSHIAINDSEALAMDNFITGALSLESIRPSVGYSARVARGTSNDIVDSMCVYRRRVGPTQYMFAYQGKVYYTDSSYGPLWDTGYSGQPNARISMLQFQNNLYIINGIDVNKVWNGTTLRNMGIEAPTVAPVLSNPTPTSTDIRNYYYTYYNSVDLVESNPSPVAEITNAQTAQNGGTVDIQVTLPSDTQVDKVRIYRTGYGIIVPRLVTELTLAEAAVVNTDDVLESYIVTQPALEFDHDFPPILNRATIHNNRMFGWGSPGDDKDTMWISNEFSPEYMPVLPFYDTDVIKSGGPIELNPGDGGDIMSFVSWGGSGIALKSGTAYRIQEQEVGFYGYQTMSIPGCIAEFSASMTPWGLIYLTDIGFVLIDGEEKINNIGLNVSNYTSNITDYSKVYATTFRNYYIVSFLIGSSWYCLTWAGDSGWQGVHTSLVGSCYTGDTNVLLSGTVDPDMVYIEECQLDKVGSVLRSNTHTSIPIKWYDKAREWFPGFYTRLRSVRIIGETIGGISDQILTLNVRDENGILMDTNDFVLPARGSVVVGVDSSAMSRYIALEITGNITRPIRITGLKPMVEQIGYSYDE